MLRAVQVMVFLGRMSFFVAAFLSILFAVALIYATLDVPMIINGWLLGAFPDYWMLGSEAAKTLEALRPIGYVAFIVTLVLIILGFAVKNRWLGTLGSIALYLPTFGYFAFTMFFLAGIGVLRVLWLPLLDLSPNVLRLGEIVYLPCMLFGFLLIPASCVIMVFGLILFTLSVFTWLYSKFKGLEIINFWLYKYSRHPQYLGFLVWSYGLMLLTSYVGAPRGGYIPPPSFPWLISALTIVGTALQEEQTMIKRHGDKYKKYMEKTPFMLPLPKKLSTIIAAPAKMVTKENWPENRKQTFAVLLTYFCILVLLSLPLQYVIKL